MNKQEFIDLFNSKDEVSVKRVDKILTEYCENTTNEEVLGCIETIETLCNVEEYLESIEDVTERSYDGPYTIQDGIQSLQARILQIYIESLEG